MSAEKADVAEAAVEDGVTAIAEAIGETVPGLATVVASVRHLIARHEERRLDRLLRTALASDASTEPGRAAQAEAVSAFCKSEDALAIVSRALRDDEGQKAWFYGALLRAFALDTSIPKNERLRFLRFAGSISSDDVSSLAKWAAAYRNAQSRTVMLGNDRPKRQHVVNQIAKNPPVVRALELAGFVDIKDPANVTVSNEVALGQLLEIAAVAQGQRQAAGDAD